MTIKHFILIVYQFSYDNINMLRNQLSYRDLYSSTSSSSNRLGTFSQDQVPFSQTTSSGEMSQSCPTTQSEDFKLSFFKGWQSLGPVSVNQNILPQCGKSSSAQSSTGQGFRGKENCGRGDPKSHVAHQEVMELLNSMRERQQVMHEEQKAFDTCKVLKEIVDNQQRILEMNTEMNQRSCEALSSVQRILKEVNNQMSKSNKNMVQDIHGLQISMNKHFKKQTEMETVLKREVVGWGGSLEKLLTQQQELALLREESQTEIIKSVCTAQNSSSLIMDRNKLLEDKLVKVRQQSKGGKGCPEQQEFVEEPNSSLKSFLTKGDLSRGLSPQEERTPWMESALVKLREIQESHHSKDHFRVDHQGFRYPMSKPKLVLHTPSTKNYTTPVRRQQTRKFRPEVPQQIKLYKPENLKWKSYVNSASSRVYRQPCAELQPNSNNFKCQSSVLRQKQERNPCGFPVTVPASILPSRSRQNISHPSPPPKLFGKITEPESSPGISCVFSDLEKPSASPWREKSTSRKAPSGYTYSTDNKEDDMEWFKFH